MSVSVCVLRCLAALCLPANVYLQRVQAGVSVCVKGWQHTVLSPEVYSQTLIVVNRLASDA